MKKALRITILLVFTVLTVAAVGLWIRSYSAADQLDGHFGQPRSFILASKQGALTVAWFPWIEDRPFTWDTRHMPADDTMSFPSGDVDQYQDVLGFGRIDNPVYVMLRPANRNAPGSNQSDANEPAKGGASTFLRGQAVVIPWWALAGLLAICLASAARGAFGGRENKEDEAEAATAGSS